MLRVPRLTGLKNLLLEGYDGDSDWNQVRLSAPEQAVLVDTCI